MSCTRPGGWAPAATAAAADRLRGLRRLAAGAAGQRCPGRAGRVLAAGTARPAARAALRRAGAPACGRGDGARRRVPDRPRRHPGPHPARRAGERDPVHGADGGLPAAAGRLFGRRRHRRIVPGRRARAAGDRPAHRLFRQPSRGTDGSWPATRPSASWSGRYAARPSAPTRIRTCRCGRSRRRTAAAPGRSGSSSTSSTPRSPRSTCPACAPRRCTPAARTCSPRWSPTWNRPRRTSR